MTNLHISAWRRRKLNQYPTEELPETAGGTDAMRGTELRAVLWQALARLPELQRTMLVLRYYEGRTDPEIAEILDISVGTVKSSIWRSLRRMREDEVLSFGRDEEESFGSSSPEVLVAGGATGGTGWYGAGPESQRGRGTPEDTGETRKGPGGRGVPPGPLFAFPGPSRWVASSARPAQGP